MKKLGNILPTIGNFHGALEKAGNNLVDYFSGPIFESQGGDYGTPWQALSPSTIAYKSKHFRQYAAVPLQATGDMKKSFRSKAGLVHLEITNSAPQFKYHQSTLPRSKIPRRPMFAINKTVKEIIRLSIYESMVEKMAGL